MPAETETISLTAGLAPGREPIAVPQRLGPYRFVRQLGVGGMGEVWLARDEALQRDVAVKFLVAVASSDAAANDRFLAGVRSVCDITHPGIVTVHAADVYNGVPFVVMQRIDGPDLRQVLKAAGPLPEALAAQTMVRVADGVAALHHRGVVHRDVKPANVMVAGDGRVVVTDFGLSRDRRDAAGEARLVAGSPAYMAPEAWDGDATPRTDVYALGCTFFELLTGEPPYLGTVEDVEALHRGGTPPLGRIEAIDPALAEIIGRAMRTNVVYRYKDAQHLAAALREARPADAEAEPGHRLLQRLGDHPAAAEGDRTPGSDYYTVLRTLAKKSRPPAEPADREAAPPRPSGPPADEQEQTDYLRGATIVLIVTMVVVFLAAAIAVVLLTR